MGRWSRLIRGLSKLALPPHFDNKISETLCAVGVLFFPYAPKSGKTLVRVRFEKVLKSPYIACTGRICVLLSFPAPVVFSIFSLSLKLLSGSNPLFPITVGSKQRHFVGDEFHLNPSFCEDCDSTRYEYNPLTYRKNTNKFRARLKRWRRRRSSSRFSMRRDSIIPSTLKAQWRYFNK